MALRTIRIQGDPVLTKKCREITEMTPKIKELIDDMLDTMYEANGVGLAGPQVGVLKRIVVIDIGEGPVVMINPVITKKTGAFQTEEGCLSLDGVRPCTRYKEIEVDYLDTNFKKQHGKYIGWTAQIIQHEVDHARDPHASGR